MTSQLVRERFMVKSMDESNKIKEIMARYRPIAPMPSPPPASLAPAPVHDEPGPPPPFYLRSTTNRVRKRGRPTSFHQVAKRSSKPLISPPSTSSSTTDSVTVRPNSFVPYAKISLKSTVEMLKDPLTLSLVPYSGPGLITSTETKRDGYGHGHVERDFLNKFDPKKKKNVLKVLVPRAVRPVKSSIFVGCIDRILLSSDNLGPVRKSPGEIEQEIEAQILPTVISDSKNKIRVTNSAYRALIGQPECAWLETVVKNSCRRLNGEVKLVVLDTMIPEKATGFACRVKIEWHCNGSRKYVCGACDVRRIYCDFRDYMFVWKFLTGEGYVNGAAC